LMLPVVTPAESGSRRFFPFAPLRASARIALRMTRGTFLDSPQSPIWRVEYDTKDVNLGARFSLKRILTVTFNLVAMKHPGCVASLSFPL